jgi:hypothetical protein
VPPEVPSSAARVTRGARRRRAASSP